MGTLIRAFFGACLLMSMIMHFSCKPRFEPAMQERDVIMDKYFKAVDSTPYIDTLSDQYKILKAYYTSDLDYLNQFYNDAQQVLNVLKSLEDTLTRPYIPRLNELNFDEAYRFIYNAAFCDREANITVGRTGNGMMLEVYEYQSLNRWWGRELPKSDVHFTRVINKLEWDSLMQDMRYADFWGLTSQNGTIGYDGSNLRVIGYIRLAEGSKPNSKSIYRWVAEKTAIGTAFQRAFRLSGMQNECFHF